LFFERWDLPDAPRESVSLPGQPVQTRGFGSRFSPLGEAEPGTRERMVASLMLANLCTVIGFGILSFSRFPVLHGIGVTVAIGAFLCLLFGAILNAPSRQEPAGKG
jgi:hypothetical protein